MNHCVLPVQVERLVRDHYQAVWQRVFPQNGRLSPAQIEFLVADQSSGYSSKHNLIRVAIRDANLSSSDILAVESWPIWRRNLMHEIVHEYEDKVLNFAETAAGSTLFQRALRAGAGRLFNPLEKHSQSFCSAVAEVASKIGMHDWDLYLKI